MGPIEILLLVLVVALVLSLLNHAAWGPWPGGVLGTVLAIVLILWILGRV